MMYPEITTPVLFHPLKHHLNWIKQFTATYNQTDLREQHHEALLVQLRTIGASQMDLYTGFLNPSQIAAEVIQFLQCGQILTEQTYGQWLEQAKGYQSLTLSDHSTWVLRWGNEKGRFVHIHPGRYSLHTLRVKAGSLKTAIGLKIWVMNSEKKEYDLSSVNQIRKKWLDLPPVKSLEDTAGINRIVKLLI